MKEEKKLISEIRDNYTDGQVLEAINILNQTDSWALINSTINEWDYDSLDELLGKLKEIKKGEEN